MAAILDASALPVPAARPHTLDAFLQVFNPKTLAIVFYFCALRIAGGLILSTYYDPLDTVFFDFWRAMRQALTTGLLLLLGIAVLDAVVVAGGIGRRVALRAGVAVSALMAAISLPLRQLLLGMPPNAVWQEPARFLPPFLLWSFLGALGYWLLVSLREDQTAREALADAECCRETLHAQMVEARLSALQAQIEPHFLFNTLANVKRLYETVPHQGREMLSSLISYLRAALPSMRQSGSTLERELDLARSFLRILKMRMGDRLDFSIQADAGLEEAQVPPMVLPTLVENAIKHGLSPLPEGGRIDISGRREGDDLVVEVRDNGVGFSASGGSGVGLANTRSRLAALFGPRAGLSLASAAPRGVVATVRIPLILQEPA